MQRSGVVCLHAPSSYTYRKKMRMGLDSIYKLGLCEAIRARWTMGSTVGGRTILYSSQLAAARI